MDHLRTHPSFVRYMDRSREYYAAQGYTKPYKWPHYNEVPFALLRKPLSECRVGLVTTAGKPKPEGRIEAMLYLREMYTAQTDPPPTHLFTDDLFWDKEATHTDDINSFMPVKRLAEYVTEGRIGSISPRFYGVPTDYSQDRTLKRYAPQILAWCLEDGLDAILLSAL